MDNVNNMVSSCNLNSTENPFNCTDIVGQVVRAAGQDGFTLCRMMCTSKAWRAAILSDANALQQVMTHKLRLVPPNDTLRAVELLGKFPAECTQVDLGWLEPDTDIIDALKQLPGKITHLTMRVCISGLGWLPQNFDGLTTRLTSLKHLHLRCWDELGPVVVWQDLIDITKPLSQLETLVATHVVEPSYGLPAESLFISLAENNRHLSTLILSDIQGNSSYGRLPDSLRTFALWPVTTKQLRSLNSRADRPSKLLCLTLGAAEEASADAYQGDVTHLLLKFRKLSRLTLSSEFGNFTAAEWAQMAPPGASLQVLPAFSDTQDASNALYAATGLQP